MKCCDTCKQYRWYYDKCAKYDCEVDARSVCAEYEQHQKGGKERNYNVEYRNHSEMILNAQKVRRNHDDSK